MPENEREAAMAEAWEAERCGRVGRGGAELLAAGPKLGTEELAMAWAYARANVAEMDRELAENEEG